MKLWKRMGAAALAGALALSMVACGGGDAPQESPSGAPAYTRLGFTATDGETRRDGMVFVPMQYKMSNQKENEYGK